MSNSLKFMGPGHIRGYPGLAHTAHLIAEYIPNCDVFVEVFAGLGRVSPHVTARQKVLNDMSDYACRKNRKASYIVTQKQFLECIKEWDNYGNILFMDPPWSHSEYKNGAHGRAFCDRKPSQYYKEILELLPNLKSDWFVCGDKNNGLLSGPDYYHKLFESKVKIMGGNIKTLVMSNKPFTRHNQSTLTSTL